MRYTQSIAKGERLKMSPREQLHVRDPDGVVFEADFVGRWEQPCGN